MRAFICARLMAGMLKIQAGMCSARLCVSVRVCVCVRLCVLTHAAAVSAEVGVASLCATQSREQVGSGWSRESVLIVFVPLSCLAIVKAASTS